MYVFLRTQVTRKLEKVWFLEHSVFSIEQMRRREGLKELCQISNDPIVRVLG